MNEQEDLEASTVSMGETLPFFVKRLWWIPLMAILAGGLGVVYALSQKRTYATEIKIMPSEEGGRTLRFAADAFSLKSGIPSFVGNQSEDFIKSLLGSRDFRFACLKRSGFEKDEAYLGLKFAEAKEEDIALKLDSMVQVSSTPDGAIIIRVFGPEPKKIKVFGDAVLEELRQRYRSSEEKVTKFLEKELLETRVKMEMAQKQVGQKKSGAANTAVEDQVKSLVQLKLQIDGKIAEKQAELTAAEYSANVAATIEEQMKVKVAVRSISAQLAQLRAKSNQLENQIAAVPIKVVNLAPVAREAEEIAAVYKVLLENYQMSRIEEKRQGDKFTILQRPFVPDYPAKPKRKMLVISFTGVGATLGFLMILLAFYIKTYRTLFVSRDT